MVTNKDLVRGIGNAMAPEEPVGDAENFDTGSENLSPDALRERYQELAQKYTQDQERWTLDINRLKSTLQSGAAQQQNAMTKRIQELEGRLDEATKQGMTDEERRDYEMRKMRENYEQMQQEYQKAQFQLQERDEAGNIRDAFLQKYSKYGISAEDIDVSSKDAAIASGWAAVDRIIEQRATPSKKGNTPQKAVKSQETTTRVVSGDGKVPATQADPMAILRQYVANQSKRNVEDVGEEEVFSLMTAGHLDVNEVLAREISD